MLMNKNWKLMWLVSLALTNPANAVEEEADVPSVNPNQIVVQVYGIV